MSIFIGIVLAAFSGVLYFAGNSRQLAPVCRATLDLCQHPSWPLWAAAAFVAFGLLFRMQK